MERAIKFKSQAGQDQFVAEFFNYKQNGYFIEIGAYEPIYLSNSFYLENDLKWKGLLVEASKSNCEKFKTRTNPIINKAVYKENGFVNFTTNNWAGFIREDGFEKVEAITIEKLLKDNNSPKIIDYISLDIEGGEYNALLGFPFDEYEVILWTIEHNICNKDPFIKDAVYKIMTEKGYTRVVEDACAGHADCPFEDWYINNKYLSLLPNIPYEEFMITTKPIFKL
jgi:FkbM family methyltransferase